MIVEITSHHHLGIHQQSQTLPPTIESIVQQTLPPAEESIVQQMLPESIIQQCIPLTHPGLIQQPIPLTCPVQERIVQQPLLQTQTGVHAQSSKMNFLTYALSM